MKAYLIVALIWFAFCFLIEIIVMCVKDEERFTHAVASLINLAFVIWAACLLAHG